MNDDMLDIVNHRQPQRAIRYETLVWLYLLGQLRQSSASKQNTDCEPFTYHLKGNMQTVLGVIGFLTIVEGIAIDFFVATKSIKVALLLGALHLMLLLYLIAFMRASSKRPVLVTPDGMLIRTSLIFCCWIPVTLVENIVVLKQDVQRPNTTDTLWCALGDSPNVCVSLTNAALAVLPFGILRKPEKIYLYLDEPVAFVTSVKSILSKVDALAANHPEKESSELR